MIEYKKVSLDYLKLAPCRMNFEQVLPISAADLFKFFERSDSWLWANIKEVEWGSEPPFSSDTVRTVIQPNGARLEEQFLLWEQDQRMVFRLERGDLSMLNALIEDYSVTPLGESACQLSWTIGYELRGLWKLASPLMRSLLRKTFASMFAQLGNTLGTKQSTPER